MPLDEEGAKWSWYAHHLMLYSLKLLRHWSEVEASRMR